ncbi:hypothetical protein DC498_04095 [Terrimonas sp.]|nr:hypothetical protein DC498_04095 [Terrimonas sp.]
MVDKVFSKQIYLVYFALLMNTRFLGAFLIFMMTCVYGWGQSSLHGKIFDRGYERVVIAATVKNVNTNAISISDMGGNYKIPASLGDRIIFSSVSYISDTIIVKQSMLTDGLDIYLLQNIIQLEDIDIGGLSKYQVDSISRAEEFADVLGTSKSKLVGGRGNTPTDGVGVTFSPITRFSKKEKEQRRFKKTFYQQEQEYYIDSKFPYQYISQLTGLKGDSLQTFMLNYRPTYKFCRANDKAAMLVYINDKYREFTNKTAPPQDKYTRRSHKKG